MSSEYLKIKPKQIFIIGGGASIREGIDMGLWKKLDHKWTIGTNFSHKFFNSTTLCFVDKKFYEKNIDKLKGISQIIGKYYHQGLKYMSNTIPLEVSSKYDRTLKKGVYKASLVGLFALSLAIYLLDEGEIYLLGYDFGELRKKDYTKFVTSVQELNSVMYKDEQNRALTHFYQGVVNHRGIGKTSYYNSRDKADNDFGVYKEEKKIKIYNVSPRSKITTFPKISYEQFMRKIDNKKYCQSHLRAYTKVRLSQVNK